MSQNFNSGKIQKRKSRTQSRRRLRRAVESMLSVMESPGNSAQDGISEFLCTGRTGRRNALPDILGPNAQTSCSDLPDRLQSLCSVAPQSDQSGASNDVPRTVPSNSNPSTSSASTSTSTTHSAS